MEPRRPAMPVCMEHHEPEGLFDRHRDRRDHRTGSPGGAVRGHEAIGGLGQLQEISE
jgi:hypothetical protein